MKSLNFNVISKFRPELMGLAILAVMLAHGCVWAGFDGTFLSRGINMFAGLIFTGTFLFLSGFGLYYSLSKLTNVNGGGYGIYYHKRAERLLIPFMMMTLPFFLLQLIETGDACRFILNWSTLYFWVGGNNGDWYISVTVMLYLICPLLFVVIFVKTDYPIIRWVIALAAIIVVLCITERVVPDYYAMTEIGINGIVMFVTGLLAGYLACRQVNIGWPVIIGVLVTIIGLFFIKDLSGVADSSYGFAKQLAGLAFFCCLLMILSLRGIVVYPLRWLGTYSLELYVLHMHLYQTSMTVDYLKTHPLINVVAVLAVSLLLAQPVHCGIIRLIDRIKGILSRQPVI